ncbi:Serine/threonine protein kinase [hydrothermal vent metagenome]|uniref:Serine/threonine protein kinase n=1 Tax=hydrothermal vent metagenome TaxID=652676 RepID=A0A3B0V694_9ZZZZ
MLKTVNNINLKISGLKIISKIGEGGMSVVYLAEQVSLKREVAVKVMRLEIANNDLDVQRFKHEAKTIAHLDHPNIISIYSIGQTAAGEVFFTMPYLNHGDFSSYILEDEQEFIELLKSVCDGLAFAHDRGVVHRDIKPENLLFDKFGNVRIADFGIAISKDGTRMTKEHQIVGSAQYMSPEQARSLKVGVHSDIYSLGIVIYERLTGNVPFDSDDSISILVDHVSMEPPKLSGKMRHWQGLIDKCLAKAPRDRFQSMLELRIALDTVPTNSLQRTNKSIQHLLLSDRRWHLKWLVPVLMLLVIVAITLFKLSQTPEPINLVANDQNSPVATKPVNTADIVPVDVAKIISDTNDMPNNNNNKDNMPGADSLNNELSIDEIKQNLMEQQPPGAEIIGNSSDKMPPNEEINILLNRASANIDLYQLSKPDSNNATEQLLQVLELNPQNTQAQEGLHTIGRKYYHLINSALSKHEFSLAQKHVKSVIQFNQKTNNINSKFELQKAAILATAEQLDLSAISIPVEQVSELLAVVQNLSPEHELIETLNELVRLKTGPQIGDKLLDSQGIETILLTKNLAAMLNEVTIEHYAAFVKATSRAASKCRHKGGGASSFFGSKAWDKPFFPQGQNHPVVCVSQGDAQAFAKWLSQQTQSSYRLPDQKEWLLLATTDNNTFSACKSANVAGAEANKIRNKESKYSCNDKFKFTAPVASFSVNNIGLYDIQGNVSEWISCNNASCQTPIAMGSSWFSGKQSNKLDKSQKLKPSLGFSYIGFRLVRNL